MKSLAVRFSTKFIDSGKSLLNKILTVPHHDKVKIIYLGLIYFAIIGAYTILRELRDLVFVYTVGKAYIQYAQIAAMFLLIPMVLIVSYFIDRLKKHELLYIYSTVYAIGAFLIAYFIGHPVIGAANTHVQATRLFGWVVYFFVEGFFPFVISLFLSFMSTLTPPKSIAQSNSIIVGISKIGGMMGAGIGYIIFILPIFTDILKLQTVFIISSGFLLLVPFFVRYIVKKIPENMLYGYKASYEVDKKIEEDQKKSKHWYSGLFTGLSFLFRCPYALSAFLLLFFWEATSTMICFQRLSIGAASTNNISGLGAFLMSNIFFAHLYGFFLSFFVARLMLTYLGQRKSLMAIPIATGLLVIAYFSTSNPALMMLYYPLIRAINISMSYSIREALYIPTTKYIRYKSKSWIDSFGSKGAKGVGAVATFLTERIGGGTHSVYMTICVLIAICWTMVANYSGKKYEKAVENNEIIS